MLNECGQLWASRAAQALDARLTNHVVYPSVNPALRVRECVLCKYSYAGGRLADWIALLRVRAYVRCRCRFTKVKRLVVNDE